MYVRLFLFVSIIAVTLPYRSYAQETSTTFRTFAQYKLWRDKLIAFNEKQGSIVHWHSLDDQEFLKELKRKFMEEAHEVCSATTKEEIMEEIADVLEVVRSLCKVYDCSLEEIIAVQEKKREERGGFENRIFVTTVEHKAGSFGEKYCLAYPEKSPEIRAYTKIPIMLKSLKEQAI